MLLGITPQVNLDPLGDYYAIIVAELVLRGFLNLKCAVMMSTIISI